MLPLTKKAKENLKVINRRERKKSREAERESKLKTKRCYICGAMENLVNHHVNGGKKRDREENPYQQLWVHLKFTRVWLCRPHEDKVHHRNKRVTKYLSWFLEVNPELN